GILLAKLLHAANGAHHGRVVSVAERAPELGEAATDSLTADVHGHVSREGDALVPILAQQLAARETEVAAHGSLDFLDARRVRSRRRNHGNLGIRELLIDGPTCERRLGGEPDQGSLELADVRLDALGEQHRDVVAQVNALELSL